MLDVKALYNANAMTCAFGVIVPLPMAAEDVMRTTDAARALGFGLVSHRLAQAFEPLFGPVLAVLPFDDEDHAVQLANGTAFGLVAGVWTRDGARQFRMARRVKAGQVFINNYGAGGGVELPFGGVKSSGYGREKGFDALLGFTTLKTVAFRHG